MRHSRQMILLVTAALAMVTALCSAPGATANAPPSRAKPAHRVDGMTGGELLGQVWNDIYSTSGQTGSCVTLGKTGHVIYVNTDFGTVCTVAGGTPLFILGWSTTCSDVEPPPYFAVGEAAQQACARKAIDLDMVTAITVIVDGGRPVNIHTSRFEAYTPLQHVQLPPDNFVGIPPGPATLSAFGWITLVEHLHLGLHHIQLEIAFASDAFVRDWAINVVRQHAR
jgi:hypothetical protein